MDRRYFGDLLSTEYSYSWNLIFISSWNNLSSLVAMMSIARCVAAGEQTRIDLSKYSYQLTSGPRWRVFSNFAA